MVTHDYETMRFCVNDYLKYIRAIDQTLSEIAEDIQRIESQLTLMGMSFDEGHGSGNHDKLADGVIKAQELRQRWQDNMAHFSDDYDHAKELCLPVHPSRYALWLHEVEGYTWAFVGRKIGYSERQAKTMGHQGIIDVYYVMPEEFRRDPIPNAMPR